jgi:hypothetical protein
MNGRLREIEEENKKLKVARNYRVERMAEYQQYIQEYRHQIQQIDNLIAANTDTYLNTSAQLRAMNKKQNQ